MKMISCLLLLSLIFLNINCSIVKTTTAENTAANTQNSAVTQTAQSADNSSQNAETGVKGQENTPDVLIKDLYKTHEKDQGKILNGKSRTLIDKYFDKNLADLIWKDLTTHKDEVGVIDFDLFYNTQDPEIKKLVVGAPKTTGDKATVPVTFENGGEKQTINYLMTRQKSDWKISDINYGEGNTLLKYFKEDAQTAKNTEKDGNFEGTYQVGDTTCTVKPIKMAFEVKWAKGSGTMVFYFVGEGEDDFKYSSEDKGSGVDTFVFDDAGLTTGKFIRADGKEMNVKKSK